MNRNSVFFLILFGMWVCITPALGTGTRAPQSGNRFSSVRGSKG